MLAFAFQVYEQSDHRWYKVFGSTLRGVTPTHFSVPPAFMSRFGGLTWHRTFKIRLGTKNAKQSTNPHDALDNTTPIFVRLTFYHVLISFLAPKLNSRAQNSSKPRGLKNLRRARNKRASLFQFQRPTSTTQSFFTLSYATTFVSLVASTRGG